MSNLPGSFTPQLTDTWKRLFGAPLYVWTSTPPAGLPVMLPAALATLKENPAQISLGGKKWLVACSTRARVPFYLASPAPSGDDEPPSDRLQLLALLLALLDHLAVEQQASQKLTGELRSTANRLNFVFEMAQVVAQSSDLTAVLNQLVKGLYQVVSAEDVCLILQEGPSTRLVSASGRSLPEYEQLIAFADHARKTLLLPEEQELPAALALANPELRSLALAPLSPEDGFRGLLGLINPPQRSLSIVDQQLLVSVSDQISLLITTMIARKEQESSRRLDHELGIAAQIQANLLPTTLPQVAGLEFAASLKPAYHVGGDFYAVHLIQDGVAVIIGDVAGKGIPAALITALMHATLKSEIQHSQQAAPLLVSMNRLLYDELNRSNTLVTAFLALLQTGPLRLSYASAGHTSALLWRAQEGEIRELERTGLPLGIERQINLAEKQVLLDPGDVLLAYSDGITEAENQSGQIFGVQALIDILFGVHPLPASKQLKALLDGLDVHRGEVPLRDDVALFFARVNPEFEYPAEAIPFVYAAERRNIRAIATLARQQAARLDFPSAEFRVNFLNELELAVSEIATNIVIHAYKDVAYPARIQGRITSQKDSIWIDSIDSGAPFDPHNNPVVHQKLEPDGPTTGGYGLKLARGLLNVCAYARLPGGRNHWHLEKTVPGPGDQQQSREEG